MTSAQIHIGNMSHETAIGILKLMLEAMETYDGISPTPARINAFKMAIKALEKEPKPMVEIDLYSVIKQKYIEREVLDKIRAEIEKLQKMCDKNDLNLMAQYSAFGMALDILDKYKAESEE